MATGPSHIQYAYVGFGAARAAQGLVAPAFLHFAAAARLGEQRLGVDGEPAVPGRGLRAASSQSPVLTQLFGHPGR